MKDIGGYADTVVMKYMLQSWANLFFSKFQVNYFSNFSFTALRENDSCDKGAISRCSGTISYKAKVL